MKTRTVGGVQPAMRQRAVQTLQAVTLSILPSQQPILSQPIGIITGNVAKSYQIKIFGIAEKNKNSKEV